MMRSKWTGLWLAALAAMLAAGPALAHGIGGKDAVYVT